jgi:hypothetical protein
VPSLNSLGNADGVAVPRWVNGGGGEVVDVTAGGLERDTEDGVPLAEQGAPALQAPLVDHGRAPAQIDLEDFTRAGQDLAGGGLTGAGHAGAPVLEQVAATEAHVSAGGPNHGRVNDDHGHRVAEGGHARRVELAEVAATHDRAKIHATWTFLRIHGELREARPPACGEQS